MRLSVHSRLNGEALTHNAFTKEYLTDGLSTREATEPKDMAFGIWAVLGRAGVANLPVPSYAQPIGDIYRILSARVSHFTSSLHLLYLASLSWSSGQLSWVPNWSGVNQNNWNMNVNSPWLNAGQQITNEYGYHLFPSSISSFWHIFPPTASLAQTTDQAQFQFDSTDTILTTRARRVCKIKKCFHFQETNPDFQSSRRYVRVHVCFRLMCSVLSTS